MRLKGFQLDHSYWAMMTIMPTPAKRAMTSMIDCFHLTLTSSSGMTETVAM